MSRQLVFADVVGYLVPGLVLLASSMGTWIIYGPSATLLGGIAFDDPMTAVVFTVLAIPFSYLVGFCFSAICSFFSTAMGDNGASFGRTGWTKKFDPLANQVEQLSAKFPLLWLEFISYAKSRSGQGSNPDVEYESVEYEQVLGALDSLGPDATYVDRLWVLRNCARNFLGLGLIMTALYVVLSLVHFDIYAFVAAAVWALIAIGSFLRFVELGRDIVIYRFRNALAYLETATAPSATLSGN